MKEDEKESVWGKGARRTKYARERGEQGTQDATVRQGGTKRERERERERDEA